MSKLPTRTAGLIGWSVLSVALVAGCASAVDGQGVLGSASSSLDRFPSQPVRSALPSTGGPSPTLVPSSSPTLAPTPTPTPPASSSAPPAVDLARLLVPRPSGARGWSTKWGHVLRPSVAQFATQFYPASSRSEVVATLHAQGLTGIAHQTWVAKDTDQIDLVLLRFDSAGGALSRYLAVTTGTASRKDVHAFGLTGHSSAEAQGFRESGQDKYGYVRARAYGRLTGSTIVLEAFFFSPGKFAEAEMVRWTNAQLRRLT